MAVDLIDNNSFVQSIIDQGKITASERNTGDLGKDQFLNLLILQLKYQDPLNPVEDKDFIAQMAQFSSLEQMQNMNASFAAMKGVSMIGKYVNATMQDSVTGVSMEVSGHVENVIMQGGRTFVLVDGKQIPLEQVYTVADGFNPLDSSLSAYTNLIGYTVKGAVYDITSGEIVSVSGDVTSLAKGTYEDYAMLNNATVTVIGLNKNGVMSGDRKAVLEYLERIHAETDPAKRKIEIFVTDDSGKTVPVGATLQSYELLADGTVKAVVDNLPIPVTSVSTIRRADGSVVPAEKDDETVVPPGDVDDEADEKDALDKTGETDETNGANGIGNGDGNSDDKNIGDGAETLTTTDELEAENENGNGNEGSDSDSGNNSGSNGSATENGGGDNNGTGQGL